MKRFLLAASLLLASSAFPVAENSDGSDHEPELVVASPLGGRQGATFEMEVRGKALAAAYAAWFECSDVRATLRNVEEAAPEPKGPAVGKKGVPPDKPKTHEYKASLVVTVAPTAPTGLHTFRLLTPRG